MNFNRLGVTLARLNIFKNPTRSNSTLCHPDFTLWPNFFTPCEQQTLLTAALKKLDSMESRQFRRRRKETKLSLADPSDVASLQDLFFPEEYYDFQEVALFCDDRLVLPPQTVSYLFRDITTGLSVIFARCT